MLLLHSLSLLIQLETNCKSFRSILRTPATAVLTKELTQCLGEEWDDAFQQHHQLDDLKLIMIPGGYLAMKMGWYILKEQIMYPGRVGKSIRIIIHLLCFWAFNGLSKVFWDLYIIVFCDLLRGKKVTFI